MTSKLMTSCVGRDLWHNLLWTNDWVYLGDWCFGSFWNV